MNNKRTNKPRKERILVGNTTQTAIPTGNHVNTNNTLNIGNQDIAAISRDDSAGSTIADGFYITAGTTAVQVNAIEILQGTPKSSAINTVNPFGAGDLAVVRSGIITKDSIQSFSFTRPNYGKLNVNYITGFATPEDGATYGIYVDPRGTRQMRDAGYTDMQAVYTAFNTPAYSTLSAITAPKGHLIQNLLMNLNRYSRLYVNTNGRRGQSNFAAFAIDSTAAATGQVINTIVNGTSFNWFTEAGVTTTYTADYALVQALATAKLNGNITGAEKIVPIDLTTAGTVTVDGIMIIGLDEVPASAFTDITNVRTTALVELRNYFVDAPANTQMPTTKIVACDAAEAQNTGFNWYIQWKYNHGLNILNAQTMPHNDFYLIPTNYIDQSKLYNAYIIDYVNEEIVMDGRYESPQRVTILMEATATNSTATVTTLAGGTGNYTYAGTNSTLIPLLEGTIGDWLQSAQPYSNQKVVGSATATTYFAV